MTKQYKKNKLGIADQKRADALRRATERAMRAAEKANRAGKRVLRDHTATILATHPEYRKLKAQLNSIKANLHRTHLSITKKTDGIAIRERELAAMREALAEHHRDSAVGKAECDRLRGEMGKIASEISAKVAANLKLSNLGFTDVSRDDDGGKKPA